MIVSQEGTIHTHTQTHNVRSDPFGGLLRIVFPGYSLSSPQRAVRQLRVLIEKKCRIFAFLHFAERKEKYPHPLLLI